RYLPALLGAAVFLGLGPLIGPTRLLPPWPWLAPLTAYLGGARPMAAFPIFPWGAWGLLGVALGHIWVRQTRAHGQARVFLLTGVAGLLCWLAVIGVRAIDPHVIRYPSDVAQNMGPGAFFYRLGIIGGLAAVAWMVTHVPGSRFSGLQQFVRSAPLSYWIHAD